MKHPAPLLFAALLAAAATAQDTQKQDQLAMGKMWTYENPPLAYLEQEYGFKPDQKWLDSLRLAALRLGERENPWCSASFVSPKGLIMTNHHCVRDQLAQIQGEEHDWITDGFAAKALADEVKIPGLTVQQLVAQEDITAKVDDGVAAGDSSAAVSKKREENQKKLREAADAANPGYMHQVVSLYQGAVVQLYRNKVYDDLRLVMAVNLQSACFGGDPDNFTYPRWSIDFAFVRAYDNGAPADTAANYFHWRNEGARQGELVFVPGNPGNTNRLMTTAQLECQRDVEYPITLEQLSDEMATLRPFAGQNPALLTTLLGWENSYKAIKGMYEGLQAPALMALKQAHEQRFKAAVAADPALTAKFGKVWDELAALTQRRRAVHPRTVFHQAGYCLAIEKGLQIAAALDDARSDEDRQEARELAENSPLFPFNPITAPMYTGQLAQAAKWLPADDPYLKAVLGDGDAAAAIRRLSKSKLYGKDGEKVVKELLEGGADGFAASDDPAIVAARALYRLQRADETESKAVEAAIAQQGALLGRALHAVYGSKVSPDATMTLRFSEGKVLGYDYNGTIAPWATSFYGLYARNVEFTGDRAFDLPQPWLDAKDKIEMTRKVCFASTNDIVGGNSGSCVVDKDLQVVGLIFDGNIESLPNDFYYTEQKARAVSVHTDAIVQALSKVYGMQRLVDELQGVASPGATKAGN
jgi:hypothetical protein